MTNNRTNYLVLLAVQWGFYGFLVNEISEIEGWTQLWIFPIMILNILLSVFFAERILNDSS